MATTLRRLIFVFVALATLSALATPAVATGGRPLQTDCNNPPDVIAVADLRAGMFGTAYTVVQDRTVSEFDVEVLGVLPNAIYPLIDMIVIEASGPVIEQTGGIVAGFSGSPVYIDGKLAGAIAYGFSGNSMIAGVTPAEAMLRLIDYPATTAPPVLEESAMSALEMIEASVGPLGGLELLPIPVGVGGVSADRLDALQQQFDDRRIPAIVYPASGSGSGTGGAPGDGVVMPGESMSAVLATGDAFWFVTGTATYCDGDTVLGFGHPFWEAGLKTNMSLNEADVVTIVAVETELWDQRSFKLLTLGEPVGRVDFDGNGGLRGINGEPAPSIPITSFAEFEELGLSRTGHTSAFFWDDPFNTLGYFSAMHLLTNLDTVAGATWLTGSSDIEWVITGTRADGSIFTLERDNKYASEWKITDDSIWDLWIQLDTLQSNPYEEIEITSIDIPRASLFGDQRRIDIIDSAVWTTSSPEPGGQYGIEAAPGDTVYVEVMLQPYQSGSTETVTAELLIPENFAGGFGSLEVRSGGGFFDPFFEEPMNGGGAVQNFDGLLKALQEADHNYDLVVSLTLYEESFEEDGPGQANTIEIKDVFPQDAVVSWYEKFFDLQVFGDGPDGGFGELKAELTGEAVVPGPGDPDGSGEAIVVIDGDAVIFDISVAGLDEPTAAHIHAGGAGEEGPVIVDFGIEFNGLSGVTFLDPAMLAEILAMPELFYVNVHTEQYPAGAVRGQLMPLEPDAELFNEVGFVTAGSEWLIPGIEPFYFGVPGDVPFLGDWDGNGEKTPGLYRPSSGLIYLRHTNDTGLADEEFYFGVTGDVPMVGDWDGDGLDTFGVFRPTTGEIHLRNTLSTGPADVSYTFGASSHIPFGGDFDGDGAYEVGFHDPSGIVYLEDGTAPGTVLSEFAWGMAGDVVFCGDWDGDGIETVGLLRPGERSVYLTNSPFGGEAEIVLSSPAGLVQPIVN